MVCPKCGYEIGPFDTECERCKRESVGHPRPRRESAAPAIFALIGITVLACALWQGHKASQGAHHGRVTMQDYDAIHEGMTEASLTAILGKGKQVSEASAVEILSWDNPDGSGITVTLSDGKVVAKAQLGL